LSVTRPRGARVSGKSGFREGGKLGDGFELAEELADHFTGIVAAAQCFHLLQDSAERGFRLLDGDLRVVLAMLFEAAMMFLKLFAEENRRDTDMGRHRAAPWRCIGDVDTRLLEAIQKGQNQCRQVLGLLSNPTKLAAVDGSLEEFVTRRGFALPLVAFMTWPDEKAHDVVAAAADLLHRFGVGRHNVGDELASTASSPICARPASSTIACAIDRSSTSSRTRLRRTC
jgi:hypothetical protein